MSRSGRAQRSFLAAALCLLASGCGSYSDFTLPPARGGPPGSAFRWSVRPAPVLSRGAPGEWDGVDALNPAVVKHQGVFYNLYSGFDGKSWHTGLATSPDGVTWTRQGKLLSPDPRSWEGDDYIAANGSVVFEGGEFLYWYQGGRLPSIGLARSPDARRWTRSPDPVLRPGPRGSWDERGVADPYVIRTGDLYYMFYLGQDRARRQRLGVARSPDGIRWEKLRSNPVLELGAAGAFDENGLGEPAVWVSGDRYWMLYTGRDRKEYRRIGLAWSADGVRWERLPAGSVFAGTDTWNSKVVCDPSVILEGGQIRVWFGGGDVASPAERLHGQIGFATLEPADVNLNQ